MGNLPKLVVLGDFEHFNAPRSVMGQLDGTIFVAIPETEWDGRPPDAFIKWSPWHQYVISPQTRERLPRGARIINDTHFHCDKTVTHEHMKRVFGHCASVDPGTYVGRGVVKSNRNAMHDGRVIELPISQLEPGKVYERLIDNQASDETVMDLRLAHVLGQFPVAYEKYRPIQTRFDVENSFAKIVAPDQAFSTGELFGINEFCASIGLQYGELDILRDRHDGRIYIIDSNNTPWGPPIGMSPSEGERALAMIGAAISLVLQQK